MERIGEILRSILEPDLVQKAAVWHRFFSSWDQMAGPELAGLTRLLEVDKTEAIVAVEHPAIAQLLEMQRETVLARIRQEHPKVGISRLRILVRPPERH